MVISTTMQKSKSCKSDIRQTMNALDIIIRENEFTVIICVLF